MKLKPKYKVGDWIVGDSLIFRRVEVVLTEHAVVYGLSGIKYKHGELQWFSEQEIEDEGDTHKAEPDFKLYDSLKAGDIVKVGDGFNAPHCTVLARIGNAVLLSDVPLDHNAAQAISKVTSQIAEMVSEDDDASAAASGLKDSIRNMTSLKKANARAGNWHTTEYVCLMNWSIVSREE